MADEYVTVKYEGGNYGVSRQTLTFTGDTGTAQSTSKEPIRVQHIDTRRTIELTLENSPYTVKAWEDEDGVRWVQIGCKKATLARWRERGARFIAVHSKDATERARLAAGLKLALAAVQKAFA